jgi:hypothetical protein
MAASHSTTRTLDRRTSRASSASTCSKRASVIEPEVSMTAMTRGRAACLRLVMVPRLDGQKADRRG